MAPESYPITGNEATSRGAGSRATLLLTTMGGLEHQSPYPGDAAWRSRHGIIVSGSPHPHPWREPRSFPPRL